MEPLPIWISGTITDRSGRTLSGQTAEAFWNCVRHAKPFAVGLNCALGADLMRPFIAELSRSPTPWSRPIPTPACPTPWASTTRSRTRPPTSSQEWAASGLVNIVGGCCGTTPDHIRHVAEAVAG